MTKSNNKTMKIKRLSLGEGEHVSATTGQLIKHVLDSKKEIEYEMQGDTIKFMLKELGVLTHDEHDRMVFEPGVYRSTNQVEFNPLDQSIGRVFD
jgi:superfamily II DNA/RNA helicase